MTVNLQHENAIDLRIDLGTDRNSLSPHLAQADIAAASVFEDTLGGLTANTRYFYRVMHRSAHNEVAYRVYHADSLGVDSGIYSFHTARDTGETFVFTIDADSHSAGLAAGATHWPRAYHLFNQLQINIAQDNPDFHFSLGDHIALSGDTTYALALAEHQAVRQQMDSTRVPYFLVLGNHESERGWETDSIRTSAANARLDIWPNPPHGGFYDGDQTDNREAYYSFDWGDVTFLVLDPFWYPDSNPQVEDDSWIWTLGKTQYDWMFDVLDASTATWKFVYIHHLVGGYNTYGRGGIEAVKHSVAGKATYEWGGENAAGTDVFSSYRSGWSHGPIHDLLDTADVDIVFKGHDHGYVYQALDDIVYQTVASHGCIIQCYNGEFAGGGYADSNSTKFSDPGYMRVKVYGSDSVRVDYVRTIPPADEPLTEGETSVYNRDVSHTYKITP